MSCRIHLKSAVRVFGIPLGGLQTCKGWFKKILKIGKGTVRNNETFTRKINEFWLDSKIPKFIPHGNGVLMSISNVMSFYRELLQFLISCFYIMKNALFFFHLTGIHFRITANTKHNT